MNQLLNQIDELQRILGTRVKTLVDLRETVQDSNQQILNIQKRLNEIQNQNVKLNKVLLQTNKNSKNEQFQKLELLDQTKTKLICCEQQQLSKKAQLITLVEQQLNLAKQDAQLLDKYYQKEKTEAQFKLQSLQDSLKTLEQQRAYKCKTADDIATCQQQIDILNTQKRNQACLIAQMHLDIIKTKNQVQEFEQLCNDDENSVLQSICQERQAVYTTQQSHKDRICTLTDHNARLKTEHSVLTKQLQAAKQHLNLLDNKIHLF